MAFVMSRTPLILISWLYLALSVAWAQPAAPSASEAAPAAPAILAPVVSSTKQARVFVIPVQDEINRPLLYVVRRGLKQAIEEKADTVVLDMKTPGGALDVTFEIMEALARFPGKTVTYVNTEAISAGAFISAMTEQIYFAPSGIIGAAAPVMATGGEIDPSMKLKIVSYLRARVRATSEGKGGYRGDVISAMIDADYELKIGDKVLKAKGELLSLTASEAIKRYGDPGEPLLAAGIVKDLDALLVALHGEGGYRVTRLEVTWSEELAQYLNALSPILLGLGLLALFIEFKTPGFGVFGFTGIALLAVVFLSRFVAGLSGHEPMIVFALGLLAVLVELFFLPGVIVLLVAGLAAMFGSLIWSMADLWPNEPLAFSSDVFVAPLFNLGASAAVAVVGAVVLARFLPKGWVWDRMVLTSTAGGAEVAPSPRLSSGVVGREGLAVTDMFPSGQVEIDGARYEARLAGGSAVRGQRVRVVGQSGFGLVVEALLS